MQLPRRQKIRPTIPLASMADIAFLLMIFFIVTSALKYKDESTVVIPRVPKVEVIDQNTRQDLWIDSAGALFMQNNQASLDDAYIFFAQQARANPDTIVFVNGDERCSFTHVEKALDMLTRAGARKVVFVSRKEKGAGDE